MAVGVGDDPLDGGIATGGEVDGGDGEVEAGGGAVGGAVDFAKVEAFSASEVQDTIRGADLLEEEREEGLGVAVVVEEAAAEGGGFGVAGVGGAFVLGLEEIPVAGAGLVEGVALGAAEGAVVVGEGLCASANRAKKHLLGEELEGAASFEEGFEAGENEGPAGADALEGGGGELFVEEFEAGGGGAGGFEAPGEAFGEVRGVVGGRFWPGVDEEAGGDGVDDLAGGVKFAIGGVEVEGGAGLPDGTGTPFGEPVGPGFGGGERVEDAIGADADVEGVGIGLVAIHLFRAYYAELH